MTGRRTTRPPGSPATASASGCCKAAAERGLRRAEHRHRGRAWRLGRVPRRRRRLAPRTSSPSRCRRSRRPAPPSRLASAPIRCRRGCPAIPGAHRRPRASCSAGWSSPPRASWFVSSCLDALGGFDRRLHVAEDRHLWLRLAARWPGIEVAVAVLVVPNRTTTRPAAESEPVGHPVPAMLDLFFTEHPSWHRSSPISAYAHFHVDAAHGFIAERRRGRAIWHLARSIARRTRDFPGRPLLRAEPAGGGRCWASRRFTTYAVGACAGGRPRPRAHRGAGRRSLASRSGRRLVNASGS